MKPRHLLTIAAAAAALIPATADAGRPGRDLTPPAARGASSASSVAIFYYAWYGTPVRDGSWQHWSQNGRTPPLDLGTTFYPARGPYSSTDPAVVDAQMAEIASSGVDTVVVSWWGSSSAEDVRLPAVVAAARRSGLTVAIHVEPYRFRTPASVASDVARLRPLGIRDFYVYDSTLAADAEWADALAPLSGVRVFANTSLVGRARNGGFQGIYTYDVLLNGGSSFRRICRQAHAVGLACAPSVGPGFDAGRATAITATRSRRDGAAYDQAWRSAIESQPDVVTITSYNEWHEGTQIEPARVAEGYASYEGAYGLRGPAAERAYLERTRAWVEVLRGVEAPPPPVPPLALSILP